MDDALLQLVRSWLLKSRSDLDTARQISVHAEGHLDAGIYHCQQAAEKALKGFLAFHDHELERTHDLKRLIQSASGDHAPMAGWMDAASLLTPYAVAYRYPGESAMLEPSREEFDEALQVDSDLVQFVLSLLPEEVRPG